MSYDRFEAFKTIVFSVCVAAVIISFFYFVYGYNVRSIEVDKMHAELYDKAIDIGVNPILIDCAISMQQSEQLICMAISNGMAEVKIQELIQAEAEQYGNQ